MAKTTKDEARDLRDHHLLVKEVTVIGQWDSSGRRCKRNDQAILAAQQAGELGNLDGWMGQPSCSWAMRRCKWRCTSSGTDEIHGAFLIGAPVSSHSQKLRPMRGQSGKLCFAVRRGFSPPRLELVWLLMVVDAATDAPGPDDFDGS
ncbi:MAG: hypothetical protein ACOYJ6_12895 [Caulobacterales bacterium]